MNKVDTEYFRLVKEILTNGRLKQNRTGIKTISIFGEQAKFDVDLDAFPILTTKKVYFRAILHELLWFIKGDTNIKYLVDNNVHIWDEWAFKRYTDKNGTEAINTQDEFIQKIKDCPPYENNKWEDARFAIEWGELGEGTYGGMWRAFPYYDGEQIDPQVGYVDQLKKVVDKLKSNPDDRRMIVSAWHPYWVDHCALPPCHCLFHFNTEELTVEERHTIYANSGFGEYRLLPKYLGTSDFEAHKAYDDSGIPRRKLNCLLYIRSNDMFLGSPFNITSYALLTAMIAHSVNMVPGVLTYTIGDCHLYQNHIEQVKLQLSRTPKTLPKLWLNPNVKDLFSFKYEDIKLLDYDPHPAIKADVAV